MTTNLKKIAKAVAHIIVVFFTALLLPTGSAQAQTDLVLLIGQDGEYITKGQTYVTTNSSDLAFTGSATAISVSALGFQFNFAPDAGGPFGVATYSNATHWPNNGFSPAFDVSGNGRSCDACGSFQILEFHANSSGQVDRLWLTFSNVCDCYYYASMTGEIRYHSQLAPPPRTLHVPGDFPTIQAAIDSASFAGMDTVLVSPGTYFENLDFKGKPVIVQSSDGPQVTIIDGNNVGPVFSLSHRERTNSIIRGFTIQHGYGHYGSGITLQVASPTIVSNIFQNNWEDYNGRGAAIGGNVASPVIVQNIFRNNTISETHMFSGVVSFSNSSSPLIANNLFINNPCRAINMPLPSEARPFVVNNTIVSNKVGIMIDALTDTTGQTYLNNLLVDNSIGLYVDYGTIYPQWACNLVVGGQTYKGIPDQTGTNGNISVSPWFACLPGGDYHLLRGSPAIDAGTNATPQLSPVDLGGSERILAGTAMGPAQVDIGAYEFNPITPPSPCMYVSCPTNVVAISAPGENSMVVNYPPPTGTAIVTSSPPPGSVFPAGTNIVTSTATYESNSATCTFTVAVLVPPTIVSPPSSTNVLAGQPFSLSVTPAGTAPFSYRWMFENSNIAGGVSNILAITNAQAMNEGIYRVVVTNVAGSVTSSVAFVRVLPTPPTIVSHPVSLSVPASSSAAFGATAIGSMPLAYQWLFNGAPIIGATASQLTLSGVQSSNSGSYSVVVTNSLGSANSDAATLTVTPLSPFFITQPVGGAVNAGLSRTFTGLANGSKPIAYQWQLNGTNILGASQTSLTLTNVSVRDNGDYTLIASNIAGIKASTAAQLFVLQAPTLIQPLTNQIVDVSNTLTLSANVIGTPSLGYAWKFAGQPVPGSGPSLTITNIQPSQAGYYTLTVTNQFGGVSTSCRVSVFGPASSMIAWGDNSSGQTNVPFNLNDIVAIAGGDYHTLALRHDGTLIAWGYNGDGQVTVPTNSLRFISIAAGAGHNLAIKENGTLIAWGRNDFNQRNPPAIATNAVLAIAAGNSHSMALLSSSNVVAWGDNSFGQSSVPLGLGGVRSIAAGRNHSIALRTNGTVVAWGFNSHGQSSPPPNLTNAIAITAGYLHSAALLSNGTVTVWGDNAFGQTNVPTGLSNVVAIAAGDFHTLALRTDGTVVGWGDDTFGQIDIPASMKNVFGIASGNYHSLALLPAMVALQSIKAPSHFVVYWNGSGILQWAPTPTGPYSDVTNQGTFYTNTDMSVPAKFFRLRR